MKGFRPLLVVALGALAQTTAFSAPGEQRKPAQDPAKTPPMSFYIAKGEADACGPGCSEWIVAEGRFVFGTTDRFRAVLKQAGNRKLPVIFSSPGGEVRAATALGRLMRQRGMTAGVGKTVPTACAGLQEDACDKLKKKAEQPMPARLAGYGAQCNSACVYALIGAKTREVPPDAVVGVHAVHLTLMVKVRRGGAEPSKGQLRAMAKSRLNDVNENLRDYVEEMGIDPELFDLSLGVSPSEMHVLSRDELALYGIDTRDAAESPWSIVGTKNPVLMKTIAEVKNKEARKYRTSMIVFTCNGGAGRTLIHGREVHTGDSPLVVRAVYGQSDFAFPPTGSSMRFGEIFYMTRSVRVPRNFLQAADTGASLNILEVTTDSSGVVRKYPAQNLSKSLEELEQSCARSTSAQVQESQR